MTSMASKSRDAGIMISQMKAAQDDAAASLQRWLRSHRNASKEEVQSAIRATMLHFSQSLAPEITRRVEGTIADVIPSGCGVVLQETFVKRKHLDTRIAAIDLSLSPYEISDVASTILVDMIQNTVEMTQRYYTRIDGKKEFYVKADDVTAEKHPRGSHLQREWVRVLEPGACDWCQAQSSAFVRHRGCRCGRMLKLSRA